VVGVAEKERGPFDEKFGKLVNETLERWKCPGLAIAVVDGDDTWSAVSSGLPRRVSIPPVLDHVCLLAHFVLNDIIACFFSIQILV